MTLALLTVLLVASLDAPGVEVMWRGGAGCDDAAFRAALQRHLEHTRAPQPITGSVDVAPGPDASLVATLVLSGVHGQTTRELRGATCADVAEAAAFVTAIAVDPGVLAPPPPPAVELPRGPPPPPDPLQAIEEQLVSPESLLEPASPPDQPVRALVGLVRLGGGLEALGVPRSVAPLAHITAGLQGRRWRVELGALYRAPTRIPTEVEGVTAMIRVWAVGARGCGVLRPGPLELPLCAGLEVGQFRGAGRGFDGASAASLPWIAAVLAPSLAWAPTRLRGVLALWFGLELAVPLHHGRFAIAGVDEDLVGPGLVSLRPGLGLELRFPPVRPKDSQGGGK